MSFAIVIPSRNMSNLVACIAAVKTQEVGLKRDAIVVVDDSDDTRISKFCGDNGHSWVRGVKPFVFSRNVNAGIEFAFDDRQHWTDRNEGVILLNDDALLGTPGGFSVMERAAEENLNIGIVGASCNNVGNPNQFPCDVGLRGESRMVCFVCVYIPRRTIDKIGLLDERYVGYGMDDDDYCFSIRNAGLEIAVHDGCFVDHKKLKSTFRGEHGSGGDYRGNMEIFKRKWGTDNWGRPA